VEILMQGLAGILFQVGARQVDRLFVSLVATADLDGHRAADHHRELELADLVAFRQVRVEIVLAREHRPLRDFGADRQPEADCAFDRLLVEHRQHTGQRQVDGAGLGIRFGAEGRRRARENLRDGRQLRMRLDADHHFPLIHRFFPFLNNAPTCPRR
jgi:hypothetical protein